MAKIVGDKPPKPRKVCKVEGCQLDHRVKGYCRKHYYQVKKHGRVLDKVLKVDYCIIEGCHRVREAKGYCPKHYQRVH
ncbi:hypothetical protein ASE53_17475 [Bacillus sp. Root11]|nr:hypothetical protein ATN07_30765 [Bacillus thuringiensis serovar israelensis]EEM74225.1 hypothetical protein bthur0010_58850 [Bacillus thuringiensis serovar pondicheriensis BGSC 4BA1]EEM99921.1 hypothetical protein bthur0014_54170 [Bacillus thuringiensis IBL 4222]KRD80997.1 hypothetical protein ASE53_17475 [Bacillus sp. Root11]KRD85527.1 hypothetical protein ASE54_17480 [Bacillus sp. Root131]